MSFFKLFDIRILFLAGILLGLTPLSTHAADPVCSTNEVPVGSVINEITSPSSPNICGANWSNYYYITPPTTVYSFAQIGTPVCFGYTIPAGYVVIGYTAGSGGNACDGGAIINIILPSNTGTTPICSNSALPDGFVVTGVGSTGSPCGTTFSNYTLEKAVNNIDACKVINYALPTGFIVAAITAQYTGSVCGTFSIYKLKTPADGSVMCAGTVPAGFAIQSIDTTGCDGLDRYTLVEPSETQNTVICSQSPVPSGFVVSSVINGDSGNGCKSAKKYTIKLPPQTESTLMAVCSISPIPAGFVITSIASDNSLCTSSFTKYQITMPSLLGTTDVCSSPVIPLPFGFVVRSSYTPSINNPCGSGIAINTIERAAGTGTGQMCSYSPVPDGFIVTAVSPADSSCPVEKYTIKAAEPDDVMCKTVSSTVPSGYVVKKQANAGGSCSPYKRYTLALPSDGQVVCAVSAVPEGFIITNISDNGGDCATSDRYTLAVPGAGGSNTICMPSSIPSGYVVTSITSNASICNNGTKKVIQIPSAAQDTVVCQESPIPEGYVVIGISSSTSSTCGNTLLKTVALPNLTGTTITCGSDPLPPGFASSGSSSGSPCGGYSRNTITSQVLKPAAEEVLPADLVPSAFVPASVNCTEPTTSTHVNDSATTNQAACP